MFLKNYEQAGMYRADFDMTLETLTVENKLRIADRQAVVMDS